MVSFTYRITDEIGLHARPAGLFVKAVKDTASKVTIRCNGKSADAAGLMAIMAMGIKHGDEVTVTVEGGDEEKAAGKLEIFFRENL